MNQDQGKNLFSVQLLDVLIIEDDSTLADIFIKLLKAKAAYNCNYHHASSLEQGLATLSASSIDLIFLDLNLEDSAGIQTFSKVNRLHPEVPVIVLTGMNDDEISEQILTMGAHDFIPKVEAVKQMRLWRSFNGLLHILVQKKRLTLNESLLRAFFKNSKDLLCILNADLNVIWANATFMTTMEYNPDETINPLDLVQDDNREELEKIYQDLIKKETGFASTEFKLKIGERIIHVDSSITLLSIEGVKYFFLVTKDVTDRKLSEQALVESERKFRSFFEEISDGVLITDAVTETFMRCNPAICKMLGYSESELTSMELKDILPCDSYDSVRQSFRNQLNKEYSVAKNIPCKRKNGSVFFADVNATPVLFDGNSVLIGIFRDVTERKDLEESLLEKQLTLQHLSRKLISIREKEKKKISADLHDELGACAVSINSSLSLLEEELKDGNIEKARERLQQAKTNYNASLSKLRSIIKDIRPVDINIIGLEAALNDYLEKVRETTESSIQLEFKVSEKDLNEDLQVALYRITQEGVSNSIRHGSAKKISIKLCCEDSRICYNLKDNGTGFDMDNYDSRLHPGMGLAGMIERIEDLNGSIQIKSDPGKGTSISITLSRTQKREV